MGELCAENDTLIFYDAAYEAYIQDDDIPHSIYEIKGAQGCYRVQKFLEDGRIHRR